MALYKSDKKTRVIGSHTSMNAVHGNSLISYDFEGLHQKEDGNDDGIDDGDDDHATTTITMNQNEHVQESSNVANRTTSSTTAAATTELVDVPKKGDFDCSQGMYDRTSHPPCITKFCFWAPLTIHYDGFCDTNCQKLYGICCLTCMCCTPFVGSLITGFYASYVWQPTIIAKKTNLLKKRLKNSKDQKVLPISLNMGSNSIPEVNPFCNRGCLDRWAQPHCLTKCLLGCAIDFHTLLHYKGTSHWSVAVQFLNFLMCMVVSSGYAYLLLTIRALAKPYSTWLEIEQNHALNNGIEINRFNFFEKSSASASSSSISSSTDKIPDVATQSLSSHENPDKLLDEYHLFLKREEMNGNLVATDYPTPESLKSHFLSHVRIASILFDYTTVALLLSILIMMCIPFDIVKNVYGGATSDHGGGSRNNAAVVHAPVVATNNTLNYPETNDLNDTESDSDSETDDDDEDVEEEKEKVNLI